MTLREWLVAEHDRARDAAAAARWHRRPGREGNPRALEHCSAVSRMCALGEALARLDGQPPPMTPGLPVHVRGLS